VNLRVRLDNIEIVNNLPARQAGPYTSLAKNTYTLRIGQAGASANAPDFYIGDLSLLDRNRVSLLVYGSVEQMQVRLLPDYDRPVQQGQSVLRIIHAIAGQDDLSVAVDLPDVVGGESVQTPQVNLAHYETGTISPGEAGPFINLPRGTYDIRVSRVADSEVVAIVPRLALESLTTYDLLLLPDASGEGYAIELLDGPSSD
jgi:hypothetical protein